MSNNSLSNILNTGAGNAQVSQGVGAGAFVAALLAAIVGFSVQLLIFLCIHNRLNRIYQPKTFLVPEGERASPPKRGLWQWLVVTLQASNSQYIQKCGLDAYFFLRYLRTLLKIFLPMLFIILPVLIPINASGGRGPHFAEGPFNTSSYTDITGLDVLAWGNVRPAHNHRYWAHLILALLVIAWTCYVFFDELSGYVRLRQAFLTSPQHRLKASSRTVLMTGIPAKWCTYEALSELFDVYPGGIRQIWMNRNFDELNEKVKMRDKVSAMLESTETNLIRKASRVAAKHAASKSESSSNAQQKKRLSALERRNLKRVFNEKGLAREDKGGVSSGAPTAPFDKADKAVPRVTSPAQDTMKENKERDPTITTSACQSPSNVRSIASETPAKPTMSNAKDKPTYPEAFEHGYNHSKGHARWKDFLAESDRETLRLPLASWMITLPMIGQKVDTIYWCREQLARLNMEIEHDQQDQMRYPPMNSAFIQFNLQVAAHMACQSLTHHTPKKMSQRLVEISPIDVIWDNMSSSWWATYIRVALIYIVILALILGWAIPVTFTGTLSHLSSLANVNGFHWISHFKRSVLSVVQGILPPLILSLLLFLIPKLLRILVKSQGNLTRATVEKDVQRYYFIFLFVQLFLVVSISSGLTTIVPELASKPQSVTSLLADNLPKASNYFFSYLLLQALTTSGAALVQLWPLIQWFILGPSNDSTARQHWRRQMHLPDMDWGSTFPIYTNLACIGLIYSVISPLILIFNVLCFGLFWIVYRYNTLYVTKYRGDHGGLFFPTAINQLFTGVYVMEICLIGLFFLVRNAEIIDGKARSYGSPCKAQGIIMSVTLVLTIIYQFLLNGAFNPLLKYLPLTLEDDAAAREEAFSAEMTKRLLGPSSRGQISNTTPSQPNDVERGSLVGPRRSSSISQSRNHRISFLRASSAKPSFFSAIESRKAMIENETAAALFAGLSDRIEDLMPEERERLIGQAFQHPAIRSRPPAVWIPRDSFGISDDEIAQTSQFSKNIWISNVAAGLTESGKVQYSKNPPDFDELDLIDL